MEDILSAGVHYNDWKGTIAADDADLGGVAKWLREQAILNDKEALVAVVIHGFRSGDGVVSLKALLADGAGFDDVAAQLRSEDRLSLKGREVDVPVEEFFRLFKEFEIVLTRKGLNLDGRAYHAPD